MERGPAPTEPRMRATEKGAGVPEDDAREEEG
jgi:hypothetical protein